MKWRSCSKPWKLARRRSHRRDDQKVPGLLAMKNEVEREHAAQPDQRDEILF